MYCVSRALIGNELADRLKFPRQWTFHVLPLLRWQRRLQKLQDRLLPGRAETRHARNFTTLLERSFLDKMGISYRLPDRIEADAASPW